MAIDVHALNFLRYVRKKNIFLKTITIGRQTLHEVDHYLDYKKYKNNDFCEELLVNNFGSLIVDSIDFSNFEGASIIFDMNKPLEEKFYYKYDTVLDIGSLEHIFNLPQAFKNLTLLCKIGGQIVHISPANNMCGHGFFQFSPELFFSYYCEENGYYNTEVYLADTTDTKNWFKVLPPNNGNRINIESNNQIYIMVYTVLKKKLIFETNIQQSDYRFNWKNLFTKKENDSKFFRIKNKFREFRALYICAKILYNIYKFLFRKSSNRLNNRNKNITLINVANILK